LSKKHSALLNEKIRVFKTLQKRLVQFKRYCEAALGTYGQRGEFHPNLNVLPKEIDKATLQHLTVLHEIEQENFIFLSERSRNILSDLQKSCSLMYSMELAIMENEGDINIMKFVPSAYSSAMKNIDECLLSLYEELEFPS